MQSETHVGLGEHMIAADIWAGWLDDGAAATTVNGELKPTRRHSISTRALGKM